MNPHRTNDPALRAEHIARQAAKHARWSLEVYVQVYDQAIIATLCKLREQVAVLKGAIKTAASIANCSAIDEDSPE